MRACNEIWPISFSFEIKPPYLQKSNFQAGILLRRGNWAVIHDTMAIMCLYFPE